MGAKRGNRHRRVHALRPQRVDIYFESDGTINDAVYLAHELGHLLAHDFAQEAGYDGQKGESSMPKNIAEVPAFFTQLILYDYLLNGQDDAALRMAGRQHHAGEMARALYEQQAAFATRGMTREDFDAATYAARMKETLGDDWHKFEKAAQHRRMAGDLHGHLAAATIAAGLYLPDTGKNPQVLEEMFRRGKDSDVLALFAAAGIATQEELGAFFTKAVKASTQALDEIHDGQAARKAAPSPKTFAIP